MCRRSVGRVWSEDPKSRPSTGQRANKGVFITTSSYPAQVIDFARSVERIVLVNGPRLAELMINHEVGVSARTVKVPKLDSDYDEEST